MSTTFAPQKKAAEPAARPVSGGGGGSLGDLSDRLNASPAVVAQSRLGETLQRRASGLPAGLQAGIEAMSGISMAGVNVTYNSSAPAKVGALATTQGRDIHLAHGQEHNLPHEAWHVVQQAQGRVSPTTMVGTTPVNDTPSLEAEADAMGNRAAAVQMRSTPVVEGVRPGGTVQRAKDAKKSIDQPVLGNDPDDGSADVPDLPNSLVAEIASANTPIKRTTVLQNLKAYLVVKEAISNTTEDGGATYPVNIVYDDTAGGEEGVTLADLDANEVNITIYAGAFASPAKLYSVLRHELIHAAQRIDLPDEVVTSAGDKYFYEDSDENSITNVIMDDVKRDLIRSNIMLGVQEIETYSWEIEHAGETGIDNGYYRTTTRLLRDYVVGMNATARYLNGHRGVDNNGAILDYWKPYIKKACGMASAALTTAVNSNRLIQAQRGVANTAVTTADNLDILLA